MSETYCLQPSAQENPPQAPIPLLNRPSFAPDWTCASLVYVKLYIYVKVYIIYTHEKLLQLSVL